MPDDATVCVLGWPELVADALPARGDLDVLVVDVANEGSGTGAAAAPLGTSTPPTSPLSGLGAAAAAAADLVLLEAACVGPEAFVAVAGSLRRGGCGPPRRHRTSGWWRGRAGPAPGRLWR